MKKTLWGYDVWEVNETIELLESQNETLTAKLTNLTMELAAKNEQLAARGDSDDAAMAPLNYSGDSAELSAKVSKLEAENKRLAQELSAIASERNALQSETIRLSQEVTQSQDELQRVGSICQAAYSDMALVKQQTSEEIRQFVDNFVSQAEKSHENMLQALGSIQAAKEAAKDSFVSTVEDILAKFEAISHEGNELESVFDQVTTIQEQLLEHVDALMGASETHRDAPSTLMDEATSSLPPLLAKALSKKKKPVAPPIEAVKAPEEERESVFSKFLKPYAPDVETINGKNQSAAQKDANGVIGVAVGATPKDLF